MTDANGAVVNRYAYDTFGRIQRAEAVRNAYAFTGREYDSETGLYYLRARYYDPEAGRFVSKDPIGFAGGDVNLYGYVGNNPANWIDPLGLARSDWWDPRTYAPDLAGARRIANEVQREARQLSQLPPDIHGPTLPGLHNGSADAWRHARWNERMVNEIGWVTAVIAGYGHELENIYEQWQRGGNSQWDEMWMDLHNNREGRSGRSAWDLLNKRRLRTIKPICRGRGGAY